MWHKYFKEFVIIYDNFWICVNINMNTNIKLKLKKNDLAFLEGGNRGNMAARSMFHRLWNKLKINKSGADTRHVPGVRILQQFWTFALLPALRPRAFSPIHEFISDFSIKTQQTLGLRWEWWRECVSVGVNSKPRALLELLPMWVSAHTFPSPHSSSCINCRCACCCFSVDGVGFASIGSQTCFQIFFIKIWIVYF